MTAVEQEKQTHAGKHVPQGRQHYHDTLRTLSQASVDQHFDAFKDIAWDSPELAVRDGDERFILGDADEVGRHPWYKSLPQERQIEIGMYRYAQIAKVGRQFEQLLIGGVMQRLIWMEDDNPEFRYATHEVTEETHHTQMFQEGVNRVCPGVAGAPTAFKLLIPVLSAAGGFFPEAFFVGILAGEEPIDHLQKAVMRAGGSHPLIDRIMQIHIAEEARHIGFAHQYLEHHVPELGPIRKQLLAVLYPVIMRWLCDVIMVPSKRARRDMGIPDDVAKEIWWSSADSRKTLRDMFSDVRMLADELGLRNPVTKLIWKAMRIDGRPARFRGQPSAASH
ncbi:diiron oxygenase [Nocardioides sp. CER19]|uniref:AurF N-oxygenase family protein n=1 Tax=Nocardioides sp. CER19 TaxID=3038538 RepID=UPI00244A6A03|nr:diiron oxygenase [Nocardioides sp. CER19]MDH2416462.1 diiron oxygenase [Nocardioides sp. CER19]